MDWYLPAGDAAGAHALRGQIADYLARHADPAADLGDATLVVQELLANAVEHATGPAWVRLTWTAAEPDLEVWDLGPGFDLDRDAVPGLQPSLPEPRAATSGVDPGSGDADVPPAVPDLEAEGGRGLFLVSHLATEFQMAARRGGGTRALARLPVQRAPSRSFDAQPPAAVLLPTVEEADAEGAFGRESFLRALVVQLSSAVEHGLGPEAGEHLVSQVGIAVGGQMEAAYRAARGLTARLTPEQLADCYVRLKGAIDGGFYLLEVSGDRIVLGNRRCPFGDVVRTSPALCRMTSSVFGGIAARNGDDGAAVVLEERIAVGDPGCRVVVHLGAPPPESVRFAHRYGAARPLSPR